MLPGQWPEFESRIQICKRTAGQAREFGEINRSTGPESFVDSMACGFFADDELPPF
jgi:hypothetical protein